MRRAIGRRWLRLGCPVPALLALMSWAAAAEPADGPGDACPYTHVLLDQWPGRGALVDTERVRLTSRVMQEFGDRLPEHGFVVVDNVAESYWTVEALAAHHVFDRDMAHGHVRMRAMADFEGNPMRYGFETRGELRDRSALFELPVADLDRSVRELADRMAAGLWPHARRLCDDWRSGRLEEEARLERIRQELVAEIRAMRGARRDRGQQQRKLEIEAGPIEP
ncbi:MAG: hypothetical protein ACQGVC_19265 [Myxococcota bacterium]